MDLNCYRSEIQRWKKDFGWKELSITTKVALILKRTPIARENLNRLLFEYWWLWDGTGVEQMRKVHPESLTRVATILRARRTVIAKLKEYDYSDPIKVKLQRRGRGEKEPESKFTEESII